MRIGILRDNIGVTNWAPVVTVWHRLLLYSSGRHEQGMIGSYQIEIKLGTIIINPIDLLRYYSVRLWFNNQQRIGWRFNLKPWLLDTEKVIVTPLSLSKKFFPSDLRADSSIE